MKFMLTRLNSKVTRCVQKSPTPSYLTQLGFLGLDIFLIIILVYAALNAPTKMLMRNKGLFQNLLVIWDKHFLKLKWKLVAI